MMSEGRLAEFVSGTGYERLPQKIVEVIKYDILDTLSCALAGSGMPGCPELMNVIEELEGSSGSSTIWDYGRSASPLSSAFVNGCMAHALDFDDTHDKAVLHAGVSVVPAAFAVAEHIGGVCGKDLIAAVGLGIEMDCRLGLATKPWIGWILTSLYGYFAAATTAAKLLRLNEEGVMNAWGAAYAQAAGNGEGIASGALIKRIQPGLAARGGILAAFMAQKGITAAKQSIEGAAGILNLYQRGEYDSGALTAGLGTKFELSDLSFKPYPCCRYTHTSIDAALDLACTYDLKSDEIEEIALGVSPVGYGLCEPRDVKRKPRTVVDAQFSIPYTVATALATRKVAIDDFTEEAIRRPQITELAGRIEASLDSEIESGREIAPAKVTVKARKGKVFSRRVDIPKGHPKNPMSEGELRRKFQDCAGHAAKPLRKEAVDRLISLILDLENVDDVREVVKLASQ